MNVFIKIASNYTQVNTMIVVFWQYIIALLLILPIVLSNKAIGFKTKHFSLHLLRGIAGFGTTYCLFYSVKFINLSTTILLVYSAPLWVVLFSRIFFKEAISLKAAIGLILGFIGIIFCLSPQTAQVNFLGLSIAVLGGILFAVVLLVSQKLDTTEPHLRILAYYFIIALASILCFFYSTLHFSAIHEIPKTVWLCIIGIGVGQVVSLICMLLAYKYASASKLASLNYLVILFTAIVEYIIWHTFLPKTEYLGAILIILGLLLSLKTKNSLSQQDVKTL